MPRKAPPSKSLFSEEYDRFLRLLRDARTNAGMTQDEAARMLGRPQSLVSKCESGERRVDIVEFVGFCRVYEIEPSEIIRRITGESI